MSQDPDTKDYIIVLVFEYYYCEKCAMKDKQDIDNSCVKIEWCKVCQINNGNFANWNSGNTKIDVFIQEMQLKIDNYDDII